MAHIPYVYIVFNAERQVVRAFTTRHQTVHLLEKQDSVEDWTVVRQPPGNKSPQQFPAEDFL